MAEQQIIQNPSVTPGALKIELSGGYVTAISGHPVGGTGGGGGPSVVYTGVEGEINVNNQQGTIGIADEIKEQLSSIPSKVSDLSDSANYYTSEQVDNKINDIEYTQIVGLVGQLDSKQDKLTFGYDDSAISSINGSAIAGQNDMSQYALKNDLDVVSGEVDILTDSSAKWNEVSAKFDTSSWNAYSGKFQLSGDYATKSDLDLYYKKTETSSKDEISDAIKDFITDADVTAKNYLTKASGDLLYVPIPEGLSEGQYYAMTTSSWKVIQGAGDVSGISTVAHDDTLIGNGNNENLGVDTTKIQTKLTDTQIQNIADVTTLKTASSTWDNVSAKLNTTDFNTYTATTAPTTYQPKGDYLSANALTNYYTKSETSGAEEISTALDNKVDKPDTTQVELNDKYLIYSTLSGAGQPKGWVDMQTKVYSKTEADGTFQKKTDMGSYLTTAKYATDSATFVTSSNAVITGTKQYALTTTGWAEVQTGTSFTGVVTGTGLSGTGLSNSPLGIDTTASINLTNASAKSAVSAASATDALSSRYAKQLQDASKTIQISDVTALQNWASSNSSTWNEVIAKLGTAQYAIDSATFVTSSSNTITGTKQYSLTTAGWAEITGGSVIGDYVPYSATVLPIGTNNTATNNSIAIGASNTADDLGFAVGQSNTALKRSLAFGVNNYANDISLAIGYQNTASGNNDNNQSAVNIAIGYANKAADHAAAFINVCTAENYAFAAGHANSAVDNSVAFGRNTSAYFYSFDFGHSNNVKYYSYAFGRGLHYEGQWDGGAQYGAFVIGGWNSTTSYATTADAPLFIIGNGTNNNPSDGFIVYRDGDVSAAGKISANGMFAVSTEATLFGQSRVVNLGDTTARGTNWLGVTQSNQGFLKYVNGGNVGDLDGTSIQINFAPDGANSYGNITVNSQNNESKIINVPTTSYNNMNTFDPVDGPNYMLRKTASGFDIGAKVVNVTTMPQNTEANTYYFVYEV